MDAKTHLIKTDTLIEIGADRFKSGARDLLVLLAGTLGFTSLPSGKSRLLSKPYYFLLTNVASALSLFRFLRGERVVTWTPLR